MYIFSPGEMVHVSNVCTIMALGRNCYRIDKEDYFLPEFYGIGPDLPKEFFSGWLLARTIARREVIGFDVHVLSHHEGIGYAYAMFFLEKEECLRAWHALQWEMKNVARCHPFVLDLLMDWAVGRKDSNPKSFRSYFAKYSSV